MELNATQAMSILGCRERRLQTLITEGRLKPLNERKEGAKKYYARFDEREVRTLRKELAEAERQAAALRPKSLAVRVQHIQRGRSALTGHGQPSQLMTLAAFDYDKRTALIALGEKFSVEELETLLSM